MQCRFRESSRHDVGVALLHRSARAGAVPMRGTAVIERVDFARAQRV
jgi:hypothetical protein